mmetsp:Transcript_19259/g.33229  ORF Transcript_19259/g.33229 Transcript_19259/m.33229 type:complete len:233 (-) Transcript_19259:454-1152(-)
MTADQVTQHFDQLLLDVACEHAPRAILLADARQLFVVLQEEVQVLPRHIHLQVCAQCSVLFNGGPAPTERVLVDLALDLCGGVVHEDGGGDVTGAHLSTLTLKSWEEPGLYERRFTLAQAWGHIPCHAKVRILVNSTGNKTADVLALPKHVRECVGKRGRGLHCGERNLPNVVLHAQAEDASHLVHAHTSLNLDNVAVEGAAHKLKVREDKGLRYIKPASDDVLGVLSCQPP